MPNKLALMPSSNGYVYLYFSDYDNTPVFKEMVSSDKIVDPINTYFVVTPSVTIVITPTKVLPNFHKTICRKNRDTIKREKSDTTASAIFLSTTLYSVSQSIIRSHTEKKALYNNSDTDCCADSSASIDMFPYYSNFKT